MSIAARRMMRKKSGSSPQPGLPLIGANVATAAKIDHSSYPGNIQIARCYVAASSTVVGASWNDFGPLRKCETLGIKKIILSSKDSNVNGIRNFLLTKPSDITCYYCYFHEPDNEVATVGSPEYYAWAQTWRDNWGLIGPAVRQAGCIPTSIIMSWWLGRNTGRSITEWTPPAGSVDIFAFDGYFHETETPAQLVNKIVTAAAPTGLPTGIAETGVTAVRADRITRTASMRSSVLAHDSDTLRFACYWNSTTYDVTGFDPVPAGEEDFRFTLGSPTTWSDAWWGL